LIDKDRPPSAKRWVATKPQVGNLSMPIKDAFEVFIKIFHRDGTEFVKEASDFHAIIGVGIASILRGHQRPIRLVTVLVQVRGVVMEISQDETDIGRNFAQEIGSRLTRHATLAGVSTAAMGNQTAATTETACSFQS